MTISELKTNLKPSQKINIFNREYKVIEHIVWYMAKSDASYDKYVLEDNEGKRDYRFWISGDYLGFSTIFEHDFKEPMPKKLEFEGKNYTLTQDEFCRITKTEGEEIYKVGDCEIWWDYSDDEDQTKGLSLGRNWDNWEREDLRSQSVRLVDITLIS